MWIANSSCSVCSPGWSPWTVLVLVENQLAITVSVYFWALSSSPLVHVSPHGRTTLSCWLQLRGKFWNQEVSVLQLCSSFSRWSWLFGLPFHFTWILGSVHPFLPDRPLEFWQRLCGSCRSSWAILPSWWNVRSHSPWTQNAFPRYFGIYFLSTLFCSFWHTNLACLLLNLFFRIFLFVCSDAIVEFS